MIRGRMGGKRLKGCVGTMGENIGGAQHGRHARAAMQRKEDYPRGQHSEVPLFRCSTSTKSQEHVR